MALLREFRLHIRRPSTKILQQTTSRHFVMRRSHTIAISCVCPVFRTCRLGIGPTNSLAWPCHLATLSEGTLIFIALKADLCFTLPIISQIGFATCAGRSSEIIIPNDRWRISERARTAPISHACSIVLTWPAYPTHQFDLLFLDS